MIQLNLLNYPQLIHGISTKADGNIDLRFDASADVRSNLKSIAGMAGIFADRLVQMEQVHENSLL